MKFKKLKFLLKKLFKVHVKKHIKRILLALILSILIVGSTSGIAWFNSSKKIFIDGIKYLLGLYPF